MKPTEELSAIRDSKIHTILNAWFKRENSD